MDVLPANPYLFIYLFIYLFMSFAFTPKQLDCRAAAWKGGFDDTLAVYNRINCILPASSKFGHRQLVMKN